MSTRLVIWGASGHALVVADIIRLLGGYHIVGFVDDCESRPPTDARLGAPVLSGRDELRRLIAAGAHDMVIAVGDCEARLELASLARGLGFGLATAVHPRATVAGDIVVGRGSVICAGAVVAPRCRIGDNVIVNTSASVDHECVLEDGVHISPGAHLGGRVVVQEAAWVGIGATVAPNVTIGARSILGAGAVLLEDLPECVIAYGVPATTRRRRAARD